MLTLPLATASLQSIVVADPNGSWKQLGLNKLLAKLYAPMPCTKMPVVTASVAALIGVLNSANSPNAHPRYRWCRCSL